MKRKISKSYLNKIERYKIFDRYEFPEELNMGEFTINID